jgi:mono/diheme cytochrome c family protein
MRRPFHLLALTALASCRADEPRRMQAPPGDKAASVSIHEPERLTSIESGARDGLGRPVRVACASCHGLREQVPGFPRDERELRQFHVGLSVRHGSIGCTSCHAARRGGEPKLHLADGAEVGTAEALRLCAQCHGPKYQDYLHGSHGGMNGYWDLSRGPRLRNHCVDCHDPHVPAYQPSRPVLPPRDRFVTPALGEAAHG